MKCRRVREKLSSYLDAALDVRDHELVEAHLDECPLCRRELDALRTLVQAAREIEVVEPPAGIKQGIYEAIRSRGRKPEHCEKVCDLLSAYVDGELDAAKRQVVADHAAVCEHCAMELRALESLVGSAQRIGEVEPPSDLRARIAAATTAKDARSERAGATFARWLGLLVNPRSLRWAAGAALAGLIALGVVLGPSHQPRQTKTALQHKQPVPAARSIDQAKTEPTQPAEPAVIGPEEPGKISVAEAPNVKRETRRVQPKVTVAVADLRPVRTKTKPGPKPSNVQPETAAKVVVVPVDVAPAAEAVEPPAEVAAAPSLTPAPEIETPLKSTAQPTLIKVASAPVTEQVYPEEWLEEMKAEAATRKSAGKPGAIRIIGASF